MSGLLQGLEPLTLLAMGTEGLPSFLLIGLTVFMLACFVGYYVIWGVTPALHTPLMSLSNAISGITLVGSLLVTGWSDNLPQTLFGVAGIFFATINIVGGYSVTQRMLAMYKKRDK